MIETSALLINDEILLVVCGAAIETTVFLFSPLFVFYFSPPSISAFRVFFFVFYRHLAYY